MMSNNKLLVILGSGPGIGSATGSLFASNGFNVALLSRNAERLDQDVARVREANSDVKVQGYPVNLGDHNALAQILAKVEKDLGPPEVVYYNAARIAPSKIGQTSPDFLLDDFKSMNIGLFVAASWAYPHLTALAKNNADAHPSLLFTNSPLFEKPIADLTSLSLQKAAQYNQMLSFKQMMEPQGVHVAGVNIAGQVSDEAPLLNAKNIAKELYKLSREGRDQWRWEMLLGDWDEFLKGFGAGQ